MELWKEAKMCASHIFTLKLNIRRDLERKKNCFKRHSLNIKMVYIAGNATAFLLIYNYCITFFSQFASQSLSGRGIYFVCTL